MADHLVLSPWVSVNGVNMTPYLISGVGITPIVEAVDTTSSGVAERSYAFGRSTGRCRLRLKQNLGDVGGPDQTLRGLEGSIVPVVAFPTYTFTSTGTGIGKYPKPTRSVSNPERAFNALFAGYSDGQDVPIGQLAVVTLDLLITGPVSILTT